MRYLLQTMSLPLAIVSLPAPAAAQDGSDTVVVTSKRIEDTERDLKACLARKCPPKEDMAASLAHAENQFLIGDYGSARDTLSASRGRNARFAETYPVEVADVTRAHARLTSLDGQPEWARAITISALDALKKGLPRDDARVLLQRLENGTQYARAGRIIAADDVYQTVEKQALAAGLPEVRGYAMLRSAILYGALSQRYPQYRGAADKRIKRIETTTEPALAPFRDAAARLKIQLAGDRGDTAAVEAALAKVPPQTSRKPLLIYGPPIEPDPREVAGVPQTESNIISRDSGWVDVGYTITGQGRVEDVEILRKSDDMKGDWFERAKKALVGRRYAAIALEAGDPGLYRVERFSFVRDMVMDTKSRVALRSAGRVETVDLTPDDPKLASR